MARKKNIFTSSFQAFLTEMAALNLLSFNARCVHKTEAKDLTQQIRATSPQDIPPLRGAYLTDVDPFTPGAKVITFAGWTAAGKELHDVNQETLLTLHGLVMCLAVESAREFLTLAAGQALGSHRGIRLLTSKDQKAFESSHRSVRQGTAIYYLKYAEWKGRQNTKDILTLLSRLAPSLRSKMLMTDGTDAFARFLTVQYVRHAIIHQRGSVSREWLLRLQKHERMFVSAFLQKSPLHREQRLLPNEEQVRRVIFNLCALGRVVYQELSLMYGMKVEYTPG